MDVKRNKFYEDKAKSLCKAVFFEDTVFSIKTPGVDFVDLAGKTILTESASGDKFTALAVLRNVPVSGYNENANGRVYSRELWERVHKLKMAEGTLCLADHPDDDGSVKDIWGVWRNLKVNEDKVIADLYLVEEKPVRILRAGGKLGTSSVGFGELSESDGKTVEPNSYVLERTGDFVMNPSQGTFATFENIIEESKIDNNSTVSSTNKEMIKESIKENIDIKSEDSNKNMSVEKFMESTVKNNVRLAIKDAKASDKFKESIETLSGILKDIPEVMTEQKAKVEQAIVEIQEKMEVQLLDAEKSLKEQSVTHSELKAKYDAQNVLISEMTEKLEKASKLVEGTSDQDELKESVKSLTEQVSKYKESATLMKKDLDKYAEKLTVGRKLLTSYKENERLFMRDVSIFKEKAPLILKDVKQYEKQMRYAEKHIKDLETVLKEEFGYDFTGGEMNDSEDLFDDMLDTDISGEQDINAIADAGIENNDLESDSDFDEYNFYEDDDSDEDDNEEKIEESDDKDEDDKEDGEEKYNFEKKAEATEDGDEEDGEKEEDEDKEEEMKESATVRKAIKILYKESLVKCKALKDFEKQILGSKSLREASEKISKVRSKASKDSLSLKEGVSTSQGEFIKYKF